MEKFLNIPVYTLTTSGTTTADGTAGPAGPDKLVDGGATFTTDGTKVGDIIHTTSPSLYFTVLAIDSDTVLSVEAPGVDTGVDYFIHSATETSDQIVSATDVLLVEQRAVDQIWIRYDSPAASDLISITHQAVGLGDETPRDAIQEMVVQANQTHWKDVLFQSAEDLAQAGVKVIGISIS
jgi:hypothetical protein